MSDLRYWGVVKVAHMTEEDTASSDDEDAQLVHHPPLWRSTGVYMYFLCTLAYIMLPFVDRSQ